MHNGTAKVVFSMWAAASSAILLLKILGREEKYMFVGASSIVREGVIQVAHLQWLSSKLFYLI